ncbi:MAG TPA: F0F1 ATP synthase subunit A [Oligoflexia bacterium]|nr:F0F1 ATP synthase subunit A [Oligoflexia bacterium]HMP48119.1 F0F1 ATP synthase subunit A [Oligoflexia bacterium]
MASGYLFIDDPLSTALSVSSVLLVGGAVARLSLNRSKTPFVPSDNFGLKTVFESLTLFMVWLGDSAMGKENRRYLPFVFSLFLYLFVSNIIGLIPGFVMPTDQMHFNLGIALVVFGIYNYWSVRALGFGGFFKHLWGPIFILGFLLFPIELISHVVRPISLSIRLYGNMAGDHTVLSVFTKLTEGTPVFFFTVALYVLGTIVSFIQAFVFSLLTMIYIRLGVSHEH